MREESTVKIELQRLIEKVQELVARGEINEAIGILFDYRESMDHQSFSLVNNISSQFYKYKSTKIQGVRRDDDLDIELNRIRVKLFDLLKILEFKGKEELFKERMQASKEPIHAELKSQSGKFITFIIYVNNERHSLKFRTNYVKDDIFVDDDLIHKERNYFKYSQFYDFELSGGGYTASFRLVVKFSIWTGLIKRFQLVSKRAILCEGKI